MSDVCTVMAEKHSPVRNMCVYVCVSVFKKTSAVNENEWITSEPVSNDLITYAKLGEIVLFIPSLSLLVMGAARHLNSLPCWCKEWLNLCVCVFRLWSGCRVVSLKSAATPDSHLVLVFLVLTLWFARNVVRYCALAREGLCLVAW